MQCPKSLYLHKKRPFLRDRISAEQLAKFKRGTDVGVLARDLFPGGIDMTPQSPSQYQKKVLETREALANISVDVIYEAVFQYDDTLIMLDILVRDGEEWKAYEVKSSLSLSQTYYTDAALQYYVLSGAGIPLTDFSLVYINKDYILQDELDLHALFVVNSVMEEVKERAKFIQEKISDFKKVLQLSNSPKDNIGWHCNRPYPCDFIGHCWKNIPADHIFKLEAFDKERITELSESGIVSASQMDGHIAETPEQKRQVQALLQDSIVLDQDKLASYKDLFESNGVVLVKCLFYRPAVPFVKGNKPYQALPLALAFRTEHNAGTTLMFEDNYESFSLQFATQLIELADGKGYIITDDSSDLDDFVSGTDTILPLNIHEKLLSVSLRIIGVKQMLQAINFYHPDLNQGHLLEQLSEILLGETTKLKEPTWLIQDILHPSGDANAGRLHYNF
jgi:hypothetical protein